MFQFLCFILGSTLTAIEESEDKKLKRAKPFEGSLDPSMIAPDMKTVRNARTLISNYAMKGLFIKKNIFF